MSATKPIHRTAGFSYALSAIYVAFVGNRVPFNVDTIQAIESLWMDIKTDDGQGSVAPKVRDVSYSAPLTYNQEKAGDVREAVARIVVPKGYESAYFASIRKNITGFDISLLPEFRKAETQKGTPSRGRGRKLPLGLGLRSSAKDVNARIAAPLGDAAWQHILSRFPKEFQAEVLAERSGKSLEDIQELQNWRLTSRAPVVIPLNAAFIQQQCEAMHLPAEVVQRINEMWGLGLRPSGQVYDPNPERYFRYAQMPAATANPSIMLGPDIVWGVGRFVAACLRGDRSLRVWKLRQGKSASFLTKDDIKARAREIEQRTDLVKEACEPKRVEGQGRVFRRIAADRLSATVKAAAREGAKLSKVWNQDQQAKAFTSFLEMKPERKSFFASLSEGPAAEVRAAFYTAFEGKEAAGPNMFPDESKLPKGKMIADDLSFQGMPSFLYKAWEPRNNRPYFLVKGFGPHTQAPLWLTEEQAKPLLAKQASAKTAGMGKTEYLRRLRDLKAKLNHLMSDASVSGTAPKNLRRAEAALDAEIEAIRSAGKKEKDEEEQAVEASAKKGK